MSCDSAPLFRERARALLQGALTPVLPRPEGSVITSGIGGSEGPARAHAHVLRQSGVQASFVPVSAVPQTRATELRLFSQNLSPNARIALGAADRFARRLLVTAQEETDPLVRAFTARGGIVVTHGPQREDGLLVRIAGPTNAMRIALGSTVPPGVVRAAFERGERLELTKEALAGPVAFISSGDDGERFFGLRWKWLETLGTCDPPLYDVLHFIHGPFQLWYDRPITFLALRTPGDDARLWDAFARIVRPQQQLITLLATQQMPLAWHEHDALQNAILCRALELGVGHGKSWRGAGEDRPLYDLKSLSPSAD